MLTSASSRTVGARAPRPGLRPLRAASRFAGHVLLVACWLLVATMGVLTWAPHATKFRTDVIVGQSMEPTIPLYSVIVVEPVAPEAIRVGDVITFQQPDLPDRKVTHRVARIEHPEGKLAFVTKGDNNEARDPWRVSYEGTAWRVREHVPHVGWIMLQAQTRWARVLLVVLPVLLLFGSFMRWLWREEPDEEADADAQLEMPWDPDAWGRAA